MGVKAKCDCKCHERKAQAALKALEARKTGGFYYYHEDCYCCLASFGDFSALKS